MPLFFFLINARCPFDSVCHWLVLNEKTSKDLLILMYRNSPFFIMVSNIDWVYKANKGRQKISSCYVLLISHAFIKYFVIKQNGKLDKINLPEFDDIKWHLLSSLTEIAAVAEESRGTIFRSYLADFVLP